MRDRSLFDRLEQATATESAPVAAFDARLMADSVMENLRRIFNSRQGSVETRPDYGMPDLNDVITLYLEAVPTVERAVRLQIEKFEPRLSSVEVSHDAQHDDPTALAFSIRAILHGESDERIRFDTTLGDDRRLKLSRQA